MISLPVPCVVFEMIPLRPTAVHVVGSPLLRYELLVLQSVVSQPAQLAATLGKLGITHFVGVPTLLRALAPHLGSAEGECILRRHLEAKWVMIWWSRDEISVIAVLNPSTCVAGLQRK